MKQARPRDKPTDGGRWPKRVCDQRVVELVQALFLEDVRPVVVFNAPEADLISTRLLVGIVAGPQA